MISIKHRFTNVTLNAPVGQEDEVLPLSVYTDGQQCISCWKMSWRERLSALIFGRVWLSVSSGCTQPSVWLLATREALKEVEETNRITRILWELPHIVHDLLYRLTGYVIVQINDENGNPRAYQWREWQGGNG